MKKFYSQWNLASSLPDLNGQTEPFMYADGGSEVTSIQNAINALVAEKTEKENFLTSRQRDINTYTQDYNQRKAYIDSCKKRSSRATNKKYGCGAGNNVDMSEAFYNSEVQSLNALLQTLNQWKSDVDVTIARLTKIDADIKTMNNQLQAAIAAYNRQKETQYMTAMTPAERAKYEAEKKAAEAAATATIKTAEAQAQAATLKTMADIKRNRVILFAGVGIAVVGVIVFAFTKIKSKKDLKAASSVAK